MEALDDPPANGLKLVFQRAVRNIQILHQILHVPIVSHWPAVPQQNENAGELNDLLLPLQGFTSHDLLQHYIAACSKKEHLVLQMDAI
jgi:hypothetical protein